MEIVVAGRHTEVSARYRAHVGSKLAKIEQLAPRAQRVDVLVSHEPNPRQADSSERVELTVVDRGPVIRAEASADDAYAALDLALAKLLERLRRSRDRRREHRKDTALPAPDVPAAPSDEVAEPAPGPRILDDGTVEFPLGDSPAVGSATSSQARPERRGRGACCPCGARGAGLGAAQPFESLARARSKCGVRVVGDASARITGPGAPRQLDPLAGVGLARIRLVGDEHVDALGPRCQLLDLGQLAADVRAVSRGHLGVPTGNRDLHEGLLRGRDARVAHPVASSCAPPRGEAPAS